AYVHKVMASVRHVREYQRSLERLYAMEHSNKLARARRRGQSSEVLPSRAQPLAALEWWNDNFTLIRDARQRGYPLRLVSYGAVLRDARGELGRALEWLGGGELDAAVAAVQGNLRTQDHEQDTATPSGLLPDHVAVFDELYARVDQGRAIDHPFMQS